MNITDSTSNEPKLMNSTYLSEPSKSFINYSLFSLLNIINSSDEFLLCSPISIRNYFLSWETYDTRYSSNFFDLLHNNQEFVELITECINNKSTRFIVIYLSLFTRRESGEHGHANLILIDKGINYNKDINNSSMTAIRIDPHDNTLDVYSPTVLDHELKKWLLYLNNIILIDTTSIKTGIQSLECRERGETGNACIIPNNGLCVSHSLVLLHEI